MDNGFRRQHLVTASPGGGAARTHVPRGYQTLLHPVGIDGLEGTVLCPSPIPLILIAVDAITHAPLSI